jgi:hypothetical protein
MGIKTFTNHEKTTRYALVMALTDHATCKPGRLSGLLSRLKKEAERNIVKLPALSIVDIAICLKRIRKFEKDSGWDRKDSRHIVTYANFLLGILDDAPPEFDRIISTLTMIVDYFERAGIVPAPCYWGGAKAAEVFCGGAI